MSVFDHIPIIEVICKYLNLQDLRSMIWVSRTCARFFKESKNIKNRIEDLEFEEAIGKQIRCTSIYLTDWFE